MEEAASPRFFSPINRTSSVAVQRQLSGDCFAHSATRCLVRIMQQCHYPKYSERDESGDLYKIIHDFIVLHLGGNGGSELRAVRVCLGLDTEKENVALLLPDLWSIREHLDCRILRAPSSSLDDVIEAVDACRRPCFSFSFKNSAQWDDFRRFFREPDSSKAIFSRLHVREAFVDDKHSGHAVNIRAFDQSKSCFELVNTWGCDWGDDGKFKVTVADLLTPGSAGGAFEHSSVLDVRFKDSLPPSLQANVATYLRLHAKVRRSELREIFSLMDKDGNKQVTMREFIMAGGWGTLKADISPRLRLLQQRVLDLLFYLHFDMERREGENKDIRATPEQQALKEKLLAFPKVRDQDQQGVLVLLFSEIAGSNKDGSNKDFFTYDKFEHFFEATVGSKEYQAQRPRKSAPKRAPDGTGKRIYDAAKAGDIAKLRPLVQEWSGHDDVLNWANPEKHEWTPLLISSYKNNVGAVKLLLATLGIDVNKASNQCCTAVLLAATDGHTEVVRALLAAPGIDVNKADSNTATAVIKAAHKGHTEVVVVLLAAPGIDVNKADNDGMTAVLLAATEGHTEVVRALLAAPGIDVNKATDGWTAVIIAAHKGHTEVVRALLAAPGIDVNKADNNGRTAVMKAAHKGHTEVVVVLLAAPGIDVNKEDSTGWTAVLLSVSEGQTEVVRALLAAPGIDVNKAENKGWTAVMKAAKKGHTDILKALLAAPGIDVNKADNTGWTAVMRSASEGQTEVVRALLAAPGIDVNKADNKGWTAVMKAAYYGHTDVVSAILIAPGIDVNKTDKDGWTAIVMAAHKGHTEVMRALLAAPGIDVNKADKDDWTAVMLSAHEGHTDVVRALLTAPGIDVNKADKNGYTAVMKAAHEGHTDVVRALLTAPGIDVNMKATGPDCSKGKTALGLALLYNKPEIAALLRSVETKADGVIAARSWRWALLAALSAVVIAMAWGMKETFFSGYNRGKVNGVYKAAKAGDLAALRPLLAKKSGPNVLNWADNDGMTAVMKAANEGHTEVVRALLAAPGIDVSRTDNSGWTALFFAAQGGHTEVVRALLTAQGIDANKASTEGWTALIVAANRGHTEVVKALITAQGIDANYFDRTGKTAVMHAATWGHTEVVRAILAASTKFINDSDKAGWTTLMHAAYNGRIAVVKALLAVPGIDLNKRAAGGEHRTNGKTALGLAIHANKHATVAVLRAAWARE